MRTTTPLLTAALLATVAVAAPPASSATGADTVAPRTTAALSAAAGGTRVVLRADDGDGVGVLRTEYRVDGGAWREYRAPEVPLLDRTAASFARWRHDGPGAFTRRPDGSVRTSGGLGLLWYPHRDFGDVAFRFAWRDARTDGTASNGGAFIRFPDPARATAVGPQRSAPQPCQAGSFGALGLLLPEWAPVGCGHEIQINDGDVDPQQTGSVYNFKSLRKPASRPTQQGTWNDYEIRTVGGGDYRVLVLRGGRVINTFRNTPGQRAARPGDPPTDQRQFPRGFFGLQNHGEGDVVDYRDVRVRDLRPEAAAFVVRGRGRHLLEVRSVDAAGNVERVRRLLVSVR